MNIEDKIKEHLKTYRAKHGKTQKEMAAYIGVSYVTYQEMERGVVKSIKGLNKLKEKTGFSTTQNSMYDFDVKGNENEIYVCGVLSRLVEYDIIDHNPAHNIKRLPVAETDFYEPLTEEEKIIIRDFRDFQNGLFPSIKISHEKRYSNETVAQICDHWFEDQQKTILFKKDWRRR